jgi:hypothetical protein
MNLPKKIKIEITEKLLNKAITKKLDPIRLALEKSKYNVSLIGYRTVQIFNNSEQRNVTYTMPKKAEIFIKKYDNSLPLKPISFTITLRKD